jgi:membrane associated rhomboid family serine protease
MVTHALIVVNVCVFGVEMVLRRFSPEGLQQFLHVTSLDPASTRVWTYFTYQFVHAYTGNWFLLHIAGNMLFLWVFGPNVEDRLGRAGFLAFYLLGGAAAGLMHAVFANGWVIGASGAIAAVTGAYLALFPRTHIKTLVFLFFIGIFMIPAPWYIGFQVFWDFVLTATNRQGNIATLAHLGGYAFGGVVAMGLLATRLIPREPYDMFTIGRQAHRRRQFREANFAVERAKAAGAGVHKGKGRRRSTGELSAEATERRSEVARLVSLEDFAGASVAYRQLLDHHGDVAQAGLLGRRAQIELCKGLYKVGEHEMASAACERFLSGFGTDPEAASVKLMLGLINARFLNDPVRAKALVREARDEVRTNEERQLAEQLLGELG